MINKNRFKIWLWNALEETDFHLKYNHILILALEDSTKLNYETIQYYFRELTDPAGPLKLIKYSNGDKYLISKALINKNN